MEWLRSLGIGQQSLRDETGGMFIVLETSVRYARPARLDDELSVTAEVKEWGRASFIIEQRALKAAKDEAGTAELLCEGTIRIGWVDAATLLPTRIPAAIADALKKPEQR